MVGEAEGVVVATFLWLEIEGATAVLAAQADVWPCCCGEIHSKTLKTLNELSYIWCCTCRSRTFRTASLSLCKARTSGRCCLAD